MNMPVKITFSQIETSQGVFVWEVRKSVWDENMMFCSNWVDYGSTVFYDKESAIKYYDEKMKEAY